MSPDEFRMSLHSWDFIPESMTESEGYNLMKELFESYEAGVSHRQTRLARFLRLKLARLDQKRLLRLLRRHRLQLLRLLWR